MDKINIEIEFEKDPKFLYRYKACNKYSFSELATNKVWFSSLNNYNDPFEILINRFHCLAVVEDNEGSLKIIQDDNLNKIHKTLSEVVNAFGILCFSAKNDHHLMWSHYADSHKGFCIKYERDPNLAIWQHTKPINYVNNLSNLMNSVTTFYANKALDETQKIIDQIIYTKNHHWAYEDEWRLVDAQSGPGLKTIPAKIAGIIFGLNMTMEDRETVFNLTNHIEGIEYLHSNGVIYPDFRMEIVNDHPYSIYPRT
jgi:hypothetical protein